MEHARIKPEILLAIRYHEFADIVEAKTDKIYLNLSPERRNVAEFYIKFLQDMDKAGNLVERSKFGLKKVQNTLFLDILKIII